MLWDKRFDGEDKRDEQVQFSVCYGSDAICTLPEILSLSSKVGREGWDRYFLGLSKETVLANNLQN